MLYIKWKLLSQLLQCNASSYTLKIHTLMTFKNVMIFTYLKLKPYFGQLPVKSLSRFGQILPILKTE